MKQNTKEEASRRIRVAMARLDAATRNLEAAQAAVSSIHGYDVIQEYRRVGALIEFVKITWRRLEKCVHSSSFDLDDLAKAHFLKQPNFQVV